MSFFYQSTAYPLVLKPWQHGQRSEGYGLGFADEYP